MSTLSWTLVMRDKASAALDKFGTKLKDSESKVHKFGKGIAAATAAAGATAGAMMAKGFADNLNIEAANDKLAGQLNLTSEAARMAGGVAAKVYARNFGGSIEEVNDAIRAVGTNLGDIGDMTQAELQQMTEGALVLSSTFDVDVADSLRAADKAITGGLAKSGPEALDLITAGFQQGLDASGDWLDTINEYSTQFDKLGIKGPQVLALLSRGVRAGARDTDAVADAFKEFAIRAIDGSTATAEGFKAIGLDADRMAGQIAKGGPAAQRATQQTLTALASIKDPVDQNTAGVALFGTQWEDTVRQTLPALRSALSATDDVTGSTKRLADTVGSNGAAKIETFKRKIEQWAQSMASSDGPLGTASAGILAFGGGAVAAGAQIGTMVMAASNLGLAAKIAAAGTKIWAAGQWLLNAALTANPIGIVVVAIAALVAGIIYAYKHSQTFRRIVDGALRGIGQAFVWLKDKALAALRFLFNAAIFQFGLLVHAAAKAFGWVPGIGPKLKTAAKEFDKFKDRVNSALGGIKDRNVRIDAYVLRHESGYTQYREGERAGGGPVIAGGTYLVGERGPEMVTFGAAGYVTPAGPTAAALRGGDTYVTVNVSAGMVSDRAALVRDLRRVVADAVGNGQVRRARPA